MMKLKDRFTDRVFTLSGSIILLCILMTVVYPGKFFTIDNFSQLMLNLSIDTIVAVGMMVLMIAGMFDLSVGSVVAFAGGMAGYLMYYHDVHFIVAVTAGLGGSVLIGFVNGWLVARIGINPMIQTLAMMGIVRGLALMLSGAGIQNFPYGYIIIGQSKLMGLQMPVWYMLLIVVLFAYLAKHTSFFRRYYFIGSNEKAARLSGINVEEKGGGFVISATLAGIVFYYVPQGCCHFRKGNGNAGDHRRYIRGRQSFGRLWENMGGIFRCFIYGTHQQPAYPGSRFGLLAGSDTGHYTDRCRWH